ncbi:hypothetical protein KAM622c_41310 [Klebsiella quasipneumoniae subsp. quasipneumoniae]|nr:hypothetical protein KAM622c_41310 [Klebsiella quasipneumoniae subsp. quasipneumoniae]
MPNFSGFGTEIIFYDNSIISLGASVMIDSLDELVQLCFGVKIGTRLKAGMLVGIGFEGVGLVIGLLLTNLGPASQAMVERIGLQLTVVDTGWPTASTIGWGSPLMLPVVVGFIVNVTITPHIAGSTIDAFSNSPKRFAEILLKKLS